jgi:RHS repeat-associated protein
LKIAGISSRKLPDASEATIKNNDLYNDKELIDDGDLNWYDYGFRNYDAQIGRFPQLDPLTFSYPHYTPYQYAGNEPIANVDLDGLEPLGAIGAATNAAAGFGKMAGGISKALSIASIGISAARFGVDQYNSGVERNNINKQAGGNDIKHSGLNSSDDDGWNPLYKSDLKLFYKQKYGNDGTENELGSEFENIFDDYIKNTLTSIFYKYETKVRKYIGPKFTGNGRNTVPDFIGDVLLIRKKGEPIRIKGSDFFELKQKSGGLYLSSNEDQVRGHIDNLRSSTDYAYKKYSNVKYQSKLWVITTADVKFSPNIEQHAFIRNVKYQHIHAEYKYNISSGSWDFRFQKTVSLD